MGFYLDMTTTYGIHVVRLMKQWHSLTIKLANNINRKNFLLKCRGNNIIPAHLFNATKGLHGLLTTIDWTLNRNISNHIDRIEKGTLNLEIKITYSNINRIKNNIELVKSQIIVLIPSHIFINFNNRLELSFKKWSERVKRSNIQKFMKLKFFTQNLNKPFTSNAKWFMNISDVDIPTEVSDFLSLGPKFGVPVVAKHVNYNRLLADVESIVVATSDDVDTKNFLRARIANNVTNYMRGSSERVSPFTHIFFKTKAFLKRNTELYIVQADKGGCTVAMNRSDYINKTINLLGDVNTYKKILKDPTDSIQLRHNQIIKNLKLSNEITDATAKLLTIYNSIAPRLYCLPKIHKRDVPLRPIVSSISSTTYNLSKMLSAILSNSFSDRTDYNVVDTFSFVNDVSGVVLPDGFVLISLDVVSLFTNIPIELLLEILELYWHLIEPNTTITKKNFFKLISFVCDNCYFRFNNDYYQQIFGTPMGSPISPVLALIVMDHLLDTVLPRLPFHLSFVYKYVDDIVCAVPSDMIDSTLDVFNSYSEHLQFTVEKENNSSVPFLDTLVIRSPNNSIILNWYRKPTSSGRYINYYSNHPLNHKFNTIIAMKNRVEHISDDKFVKINLRFLFDTFVNNGYPKHVLNKLIYSSNYYDGPVEAVADNTIVYKKLPYVRNLTDNIVNHFKKFKNITIAKYNLLTVNDLFTKTKDKIPTLGTSGVVYSIPCRDCQMCYIGQSSQILKKRLTQHKSDCKIGKRSCALAIHSQDLDHTFYYDGVKILERESDYRKRLFLEMVSINSERHSVNFRSDIDQLSIIYCNILKNVGTIT